MDALPELLKTVEDGIATLTFNRPERMNALSTPIMEGLLHGLPRLAGDPAVKVHMYGKPVRPGRKIGHVTVIGDRDHRVPGELADRARRAASRSCRRPARCPARWRAPRARPR